MDIVLLKPETAENVGFICRAMANFDLKNLILIDPCPLDEAYRTAMHAKDILDNAVQSDGLATLRDTYDLIAGTTSVLGTDYNIPRTPLTAQEFASKVTLQSTALVLGPESSGLSNKDIEHCDIMVSIPTSKDYAAMNISHAAAIIFYEYYKVKGSKKIHKHISHASRKEKDIVLELLDNIIDDTDFVTDHKRRTQKKTWRRIIEKSMMSRRESFVLMGLLRKLSKSQED